MANKKQFNIRLPEGDYGDLKRLAKIKGDDTAGRAALLVQQALKQAKEDGELPTIDAEDAIEQMTEYIKLLMGLRIRTGLSFDEISDISGLPRTQLEELWEFIEECRKNHASNKPIEH